MNKKFEQEIMKSAKFFEKHKDEYEEVNADSNSIMKIYARKNSKGKWYQYNTFYIFDEELLEKKSKEFLKRFKNGETKFEESLMNMGLILNHLVNKQDDFSPIARKIYNDMFSQIGGNYE